MSDMIFDGQQLTWVGHGKFKATSGLAVEKENYQYPQYQCLSELGPVPEGQYYVPLLDDGRMSKDDGTGKCKLEPSWQIEKIPRGVAAGVCEPYWALWGDNRVRFEPLDTATKIKCKPRRSGFYLHDSTKGFSHGCIEVEGTFFAHLRTYVKTSKKKRLILKIQYRPGERTNGGTKVP